MFPVPLRKMKFVNFLFLFACVCLAINPKDQMNHDLSNPPIDTSKLKEFNNDEIITVHILPHTHDDPGWLVTADQYYVKVRPPSNLPILSSKSDTFSTPLSLPSRPTPPESSPMLSSPSSRDGGMSRMTTSRTRSVSSSRTASSSSTSVAGP